MLFVMKWFRKYLQKANAWEYCRVNLNYRAVKVMVWKIYMH